MVVLPPVVAAVGLEVQPPVFPVASPATREVSLVETGHPWAAASPESPARFGTHGTLAAAAAAVPLVLAPTGLAMAAMAASVSAALPAAVVAAVACLARAVMAVSVIWSARRVASAPGVVVVGTLFCRAAPPGAPAVMARFTYDTGPCEVAQGFGMET